MEAMATTETCIKHSNLLEETPAIRRFKMASGSNFVDIAKKRSRCVRSGGGSMLHQQDEEEQGLQDSATVAAVGGNSPQALYSHQRSRLIRSASTPTAAMGGLFHTQNRNSLKKENAIDEGSESPTHHKSSQLESQATIEGSGFPLNNINDKNNINRANSENIRYMLKDSCPPYGMMSVIGRRNEMEDTVAAVPSFFWSPPSTALQELGSTALHFFAVYDGHGGSQASMFCKDRFHEALAENLTALPPPLHENSRRDLSEWKKVMADCFMKMDIEVGGLCPSGSCSDSDDSNVNYNSRCCQNLIAPENVGSTAVVAVVSPSQIIVANCGDSRAVLSRGGKAIPFSTDHKPEREDEMGRIEAAGGRVIYWNGYRVGGFLAMSRAIGDRFLKQYVISEPEVTCTERTDEDECLILASDGLWDVLSNDFVCEVARKCLAGYRPHRSKGTREASAVAVAAAHLTKLALGRGSGDNISVIVIDLRYRNASRNRPIQTNL